MDNENRALHVLLLAFLAICLLPTGAGAQDRPPNADIQAHLLTDKQVYAVGEEVSIRIFASNPTETEQLLTFASDGHKADYLVDGAWTWSDGKGFPDVIGELMLAPGQRALVGSFVHTADDLFLEPGVHSLTGQVVGYAETAVRITVQESKDPPPSPFSVSARVVPPRVPMGEPFAFHVTVTNEGDREARFIVDGCPVEYVLDGHFTPTLACAEFAREIVLAPGDAITFGPDEAPYLRHLFQIYPLSPGTHEAVLAVRGVGRTKVSFGVGEPTRGGVVAGRVHTQDGSPLPLGPDVLARLSTTAAFADTADSSAEGPPSRWWSTRISDQGYFFFEGIPSGIYHLGAIPGHEHGWTYYPGVTDLDRAQPVPVRAGSYAAFRFPMDTGNPPPPPPGTALFRAWVVERPTGDEATPGVPLADASVVAIPVGRVQPGPDGTLPRPTDSRGFYRGLTNSEGVVEFPVPIGSYRILAGKPVSHGYIYWDDKTTQDEGDVVRIANDPQDHGLPLVLRLPPLDGSAMAGIGGVVTAFDPIHDGPPEPLEGAVITAIPLLHSVLADLAPVRAETDASGGFKLEVPGDTPYFLLAQARGYMEQWFRNARHFEDAALVDVAPGGAVDHTDFVLQPAGEDSVGGVIEGFVYRRLLDADCTATNDRCVVPAAGAVVIVTPAFPTFAPFERRARVGTDGSFRVDGLWPSEDGSLSYYVRAELGDYHPVWYPEGVPFDLATPIPVYPKQPADAGRLLLGGTAPPANQAVVVGFITDPDGEAVPHTTVRIHLDPETPRGAVFETRTDAQGLFRIDGLPEGAEVLLAASAEGYIPAYYPDAWRWQNAELVPTVVIRPNIRIAPLQMTLRPGVSGGDFLQVGRVRAEPDARGTDLGSTAERDPIRLALQHHAVNLPGAFFYLTSSLSASPIAIPMAGGATTANGVALLTELPSGSYYAFADRPGFETTYYEVGGAPGILTLDEMTPGVLADIRLRPAGQPPSSDTQELTGPVAGLNNSPNPFRPRTTIYFDLMESSDVSVSVFDYRGRLVRSLLTGAHMVAGPKEIPWDGSDSDGRRVSSGVYFYRIQAGSYAISRKMVVLP